MENNCFFLKVSHSDCSNIIKAKLQSDQFAIRSIQHRRLDQIRGYLGDHTNLQISIERNGKEENHIFFIKSLPTLQSQRKLALQINAFLKEERFYLYFHQELKKHSIDLLDDVVPSCYFATTEFLAFEDLTLKKYKTPPSRLPLEISYIKAALVALAKLHASGLILEETKQVKLLNDFEQLKQTSHCVKSSVKKAIESTKRGIEALIDLNDGDKRISKDIFKKKVFHSCEVREELTGQSTKFRNAICHGDPWNNNFMFKKEVDSVSCVVIDFQSYRYAPPAQDVMTFLHFVTSREQRSQHLQKLLDFYYKELNILLRKFGYTNLLSREEFTNSCEYYKEFALIQAITRFQIVGMSDSVINELLSNPDKARSVMFGDKYDFIKDLYSTDPIFRKMNFEAMEDLRQFYEDKAQ